VIQDCDTLDLIWLSAAGETAPAILQYHGYAAVFRLALSPLRELTSTPRPLLAPE